MTNPTPSPDVALAQLRHAYKHAIDGTIGDQEHFGRYLLGPAIERVEEVARAYEALREENELLKRPLGAPVRIVTHCPPEQLLSVATSAGHGPLMVSGDIVREALEALRVERDAVVSISNMAVDARLQAERDREALRVEHDEALRRDHAAITTWTARADQAERDLAAARAEAARLRNAIEDVRPMVDGDELATLDAALKGAPDGE